MYGSAELISYPRQSADLEWAGDQPEDALTQAAETGDAAAVLRLLEGRPALLDKQGEHGMTPLMWAAHEGHHDIVGVLIDAGANIDLQHKTGSTALHYAAFNNHPTVMRMLVDRGADQNIKKKNGETAREFAAGNGNMECAVLLQ